MEGIARYVMKSGSNWRQVLRLSENAAASYDDAKLRSERKTTFEKK